MTRLQDRVALITGAASGIGRQTALLFADQGCKVLVVDVQDDAGAETVDTIRGAGGNAQYVHADVSKSIDCENMVKSAEDQFGKLDILFNNAGVFYPKTVLDCSESEWDLTLDTSLKGAFLMSKYALPSMIERGSGVIIHCSSGWGIQGGGEAAAYCAAKGGLVVMTKAMAIDHGPQGIRVNCICPGDVDTPMLPDDARQRGIAWESYLEGASDRPMGRVGRAEEIARAVLFLATDASSFITGTALVVDGGGIAG